MVTLVINNSYSKLSGLTPALEKAFRHHLSYAVDTQASYFSGGYGPRRKSLVDRNGHFPTGLLERVYAFMPQVTYWTEIDNRIKPRPTVLRTSTRPGIEPYSAQLDALMAVYRTPRGIISMPTGSGKSLVIALIAANLCVRTLVIVPSVEIKKQLKDALNGFLTDTSHIVVENIDSTALIKHRDFGCLIIDEAHHVAARTYQKLNKTCWNDIYYRFFLTATPFRNNSDETMLFESIAGECIYSLKYKDAVKAGYMVPVEAYYLESPKQAVEGHAWAEVYNELVVANGPKNALIASALNAMSGVAPTLCLVKEVAHGETISALTGIPFVNGKDDESRDYIRQFNSGEIKALIGTNGILGEGVDSRPCEFVVIAGLGKAKSAFMQQVGRAVRTYPGKTSAKVVIVRDCSHKWTRSHFNAQKKILLDEYGVRPIKLDLEG